MVSSCILNLFIEVLFNSIPAKINYILRRRGQQISSQSDILQIGDKSKKAR